MTNQSFNLKTLSVVAASEKTPQATRVIAKHLQNQGSISAIEAAALYRTRSLSRRICDLKDRGVNVQSNFKTDETGQRYVRYTVA